MHINIKNLYLNRLDFLDMVMEIVLDLIENIMMIISCLSILITI